MKKRSTLIVFLAALLCLTMLFVSCKPDTDASVDTDEGKEPAVEIENVNYASKLSEWERYVSYKAPESANAVELTEIYRGESDGVWYGDLLHVTETNTLDGYYDEDDNYITPTTLTHYVYNAVTAECILNATGTSTAVNSDYTKTSIVYNVSFLARGAIFYVRKTVRSPFVNEYGYNDYKYEYTYTYYDANGTKLYTYTSEDNGVPHEYSEGTYFRVTLDDKVYVCDSGEIITVFNKEENRGLPTFTEEYNGLKYSYFYDGFYVFNENYEEVARYVYENGTAPQRLILSNGNVFVQYMDMCETDFTKHNLTIKSGAGEAYYNLKQVLVNVKDGSVTELDLGFIVGELLNEQESPADNNLSVKGDYQVATILKINEERELTFNMTFVVLDNAMQISAELPKLMKDQVEIITALDENTYLIPTGNIYGGSETDYYAIDRKTYAVSLYSLGESYYNTGATAERKEVEGGFIANNILYDDNLKELADLRYVHAYRVISDKVILVQDEAGKKNDNIGYGMNLLTFSNSYTFVPNGVGGLVSNNRGDEAHSTEAIMTLTADRNMVVSTYYSVSSEEGYDWLEITHVTNTGDSDTIVSISGEMSDANFVELETGDQLIFKYRKDGSANRGSDCATIHYIDIDGRRIEFGEKVGSVVGADGTPWRVMYINNGQIFYSQYIWGTVSSVGEDYFIVKNNDGEGNETKTLYNIKGDSLISTTDVLYCDVVDVSEGSMVLLIDRYEYSDGTVDNTYTYYIMK